MAYFKKLGYFAAPSILVGMAALSTTACSEDPLAQAAEGAEKLCGPCGEVELGDVSISGSAEVDGFFQAVATLNKSVVTASGSFEASLAELEALWGLEGTGSLDARVGELVGAIQADFGASASAQASLEIVTTPAKCEANLSVAVDAQAKCEAKAECDVDVEAPSASVTCEAECSGSCEGTCEAMASATCDVKGPSIECSGTCEGTCELSGAAECEGTCNGTCNGTCSVVNADGSCSGECTGGTCEGSCEVAAGGSCEGTCTGTCKTQAPEAGCEGEASLSCNGKCEGSCSGGCTGQATPGSASADCDASADCQAQASAQASADLKCTPPSIEIVAAFDADIDASAQAQLSGKIEGLRLHGALMLQSFVQYKALIDGEVNGEVVFDPSPVAQVTASVRALAEAGVDGDLVADLPAGRLPCAAAAFVASGEILTEIASEATATLSAQAQFAAAFSTGFQS
jgi:hypothetical protein